jgi:CTP:phosphocholine cytidylyltransferase-like protein
MKEYENDKFVIITEELHQIIIYDRNKEQLQVIPNPKAKRYVSIKSVRAVNTNLVFVRDTAFVYVIDATIMKCYKLFKVPFD